MRARPVRTYLFPSGLVPACWKWKIVHLVYFPTNSSCQLDLVFGFFFPLCTLQTCHFYFWCQFPWNDYKSENVTPGLTRHSQLETDHVVSPCLTVFKEAANLKACCATTLCVGNGWRRWGKTLMKCPNQEQLNASARLTASQHCPI